MKTIGILTHCVANNYGANLQAYSTACYLRKRGFAVVFICWNDYISNNTPLEQVDIHRNFLIRQGFSVTASCHTDVDFAKAIDDNNIRNIIVGSDCVLTYQSHLFPFIISRKGIQRIDTSSDYDFPNPFWLSYIKDRDDIGRFLMSASCGGAGIGYIRKNVKQSMRDLLGRYDYISVRDQFTHSFVRGLLPASTEIRVTPDPVFGFNVNVDNIPDKEAILKKFCLPEKYIVISFYSSCWPQQKWADRLMAAAHANGMTCVGLPMPQGGRNSDFDVNVELPLNPMEWYAIIKYSCGYVGNNMHPIIVAMHNNVPFFSYNIHGKSILRGRIQFIKTSKEYDLLHKCGLDDLVVPQPYINYIAPERVIQKLLSFNHEKCDNAIKRMAHDYVDMMDNIIGLFK